MSSNRKVALVTGGSRGIGRAICLALAEMDMDIVLNYAGNTEAAEDTKRQCENLGAEVLLMPGNVSSFHESEEIVQKAMTHFGRIDVLVNNAGITRDNLIMRMKEEEFDQVIDVNLKGTFYFMKHVSKIMMKQRSGRIINMSSIVGIGGNEGQVNYAASKAGIIGMTKSIAKELSSRNVTANAIAPGFIETEMTKALPEEVKGNITKAIPLGTLGQPEDVAGVVAFLASEKGRYITGQVISVDGGLSI